MTYRIREVSGEDYQEELAELHEASFEETAKVVDFTEGYWWIAFHKGTPAAFIGIKQSVIGADAGYFWRVGVDPAHRGRGLQKRLMRAMHAKAKKLGWKRIVSDTRDNPHSANNIISAGYRTFSPINPWAHRDAIYWIKDL